MKEMNASNESFVGNFLQAGQGIRIAASSWRDRQLDQDKGGSKKGDVVELQRKREKTQARSSRRGQRILDRYYLRGQISRRQFEAGERFRCRLRSSLTPSEPADRCSLNSAMGSWRSDHSFLTGALKGDLEAVGGRLSSVLIHVCLCDEAAGHWGLRHRGKASDGIALLRLALDGLADYWRLSI